jgi:predicted metalloprotease with PDZ domain
MTEVRYQLTLADLAGHYFAVELMFTPTEPAEVLLSLPAWIPGSYMIRDFARHLLDLTAHDAHGPLNLTQQDKQSWRLAHRGHAVTVRYQLYAFDLSVRANYLSSDIAVFNPAAGCLQVHGAEQLPHALMVDSLPEHWQLACALPTAQPVESDAVHYVAANYQQLIDSPLLAGELDIRQFDVGGIRHHLVLCGAVATDSARIAADLQKLCLSQQQVFGAVPTDLTEYWFLTWVVDSGYGGLEHRNSTLLLCNRFDLPNPQQPTLYTPDYQNFLALCSHEYFHSWWVKRARPAPYLNYQLAQEQYSTQLWLYEGFTSYYDDLSLLRTGMLTLPQYLELLCKTISRLARSPANLRQSLADSSFNAWTRFYRQDENAANAVVSYYAKGSLLAFCLDAFLHQAGKSLDGLMQLCWQHYGAPETGSDDETLFALLGQYSGDAALVSQCRRWVSEAVPLPIAEAAASLGLQLQWRSPRHITDLSGAAGAAENPEPGFIYEAKAEGLVISSVRNGTAAHQAGLSAGDTLVAVNSLKASEATWQQLLGRHQPGDTLTLHLFRQQKLLCLQLILPDTPQTVAMLSATAQITPWPGVPWPASAESTKDAD